MPIVGIGASAGGVEALREFFRQVPAETDMAFVVIMHLSPDQESNLTEVLRQVTDLAVAVARDGDEVRGGHAYVIPPRKRLEIEEGILRLEDTQRTHETSTIDRFFRSLAADQAANAVGIVLSGNGTDGTLGLRSIKEEGGVAFVQSPDEAQYDHMPKSAVATGLVDLILPAGKLAERLQEYRSTAGGIDLPPAEEQLDTEKQTVLQKIFTRLYTEGGHDFSGYKRSTIFRRLERRMQVRSVPTLEEYLRLLREDEEEVRILEKNLLITVTSFFRDPKSFDALGEQVLPSLFEDKGPSDQLRVWAPGCATGEEAYSLGMLLLEQADALEGVPALQIFASDIDGEALEFGREGLYPETIAADVSAERLDRFFRREDAYYRVGPRLREIVLFAEHDLLSDPPFSNLDLISCRNVLIYLQPDVQDHVLRLLHYGLRDGGYLFLGRAEGVGRTTDLFTTVDKSSNVLRARVLPDDQEPQVPISALQGTTDVSAAFLGQRKREPEAASSGVKRSSAAELHRQALMEGMASILVDKNYQIVHLSDRASRYLGFEGGTPSLELLSLVPEDLRPLLRTALYHAFEKGEASRHTRVETSIDGGSPLLDVTVEPLEELGAQTYAHVRLEESAPTDAPEADEAGSREEERQAELERTREQLQTTTEEYEAASEEMEAANEELLSMNEELKSKNEELKTSKEELQSVNEELKTTNQELKHKIEELREANSDLENLMAATEIATLFLDQDLNIERFTPRVTELFNIRPPDVGRPLSDFTRRFEYEGLLDDARRVLRNLTSIEREIRQNEETWFLVRLRPYRTVEETVEGVVLTFVDISNRRRLEQKLVDATEEARRRIGWDLHDTLSSDLSALTLLASNLKRQLAEKGLEEAEEMEQIIEMLQEGVETARTLARELVPVALQDDPLARALQQLCTEQGKISDLQYVFDGDLDETLPASTETATHLYRIAREALVNARLHADASRVQVSLRREDGVLRMTIRDDGTGISEDPGEKTADGDDDLGLRFMTHRANLIGGTLRVESRDEGGTVVQCDLPLDAAKRD